MYIPEYSKKRGVYEDFYKVIRRKTRVQVGRPIATFVHVFFGPQVAVIVHSNYMY